jgi:BASS family bile acid:Na+ symporter
VEHMAEMLQKLLGITLIIFVAGNLLDMGLKLDIAEARQALRNVRFIVLSLVWSFLFCPLLAYMLTKALPMPQPYAIGLLFLGMAPGAPFLPLVAEKARGNLAYVAAFMVLTVVGTVVFMPLAVPLLVPGFTAGVWMIARPLVLYVASPLALGVATRIVRKTFADGSHPYVKNVTMIATLIMLLLILWMYGKDFINAIGEFAIASLVLFCALVTIASYRLAFGLPEAQKSVIALGLCTRNIGAAIAPLFAVKGTDRRSIAMCVLAVPITVICSFVAARPLARRSTIAEANPDRTAETV